jgi:dihydroxyacetone kinase-like protein
VSALPTAGGGALVREVAAAVVAARARLSEIDGLIGDGDHGNNMAKGFARAAERIGDADALGPALQTVSDVLMGEIGGSMGPLYGMLFADMAAVATGREALDAPAFATMLRAGLEGVLLVGDARPGDKTMLDALAPAVAALEAEADLAGGLRAMRAAAEAGRDATVDMVARVGRASRLGERSRGVPDAGATSCALILATLAEGALARLA